MASRVQSGGDGHNKGGGGARPRARGGVGGLGHEHGGGVRPPAYKVGSGPMGKMNLAFLFSFRHILDFFNKLHVGPRPSQQNDLCFCHLSADKWVRHVRTAVNWL
jgi:hypothetical protein